MNSSGAFRTCYECKDRYPGCHGSCEAYQKEKQTFDSIRDRERERRKLDYDIEVTRRKILRKR